MKNIRLHIIKIGICMSKVFLNIIYFFLKCFPCRNKISLLSRQSNRPSIDFELIETEILNRNDKVKVKILCKKLEDSLIERIKYCFYILKCMYHIATSKVCILDGYSIPISILKHKKKLEIIQIWHASGAIKKFGLQSLNKKAGRNQDIAKIMNMHRNYSHVMAPSIETAEFYKEAFGIEESGIFINGLPRLDYLLDEDLKENVIEKFHNEYPQNKNKKTILYVPTFRKNVDNTEFIQKLIKSINLSKYNLIIKLHPLDNSNIEEEYTVNKKYSTYDLLKISDYIITDYSAVAFEASILNKPLYFYVYDIDKYDETSGLNINLFEEINNSTSTNAKEIIKAIENDEYDSEELEKFRTKYMGTNYFNNTSKLVDFIFKYLNGDEKNEEDKKENQEKNKENEKKIKENINEKSKTKLNI